MVHPWVTSSRNRLLPRITPLKASKKNKGDFSFWANITKKAWWGSLGGIPPFSAMGGMGKIGLI